VRPWPNFHLYTQIAQLRGLVPALLASRTGIALAFGEAGAKVYCTAQLARGGCFRHQAAVRQQRKKGLAGGVLQGRRKRLRKLPSS